MKESQDRVNWPKRGQDHWLFWPVVFGLLSTLITALNGPLLEIVDSSTERQLDLEKSPNLRTEAVLGQLKALDNTSSLNLNSVGEVRWNYERFTRLADSYTKADSVDIRRQARKCR